MALRDTWEIANAEFDEEAFSLGDEVMAAFRDGGPQAEKLLQGIAAFDRASLIYGIGRAGLADVILVPAKPVDRRTTVWVGGPMGNKFPSSHPTPIEAIKVDNLTGPNPELLLMSDVWQPIAMEHHLQQIIELNLDEAARAGHRLAVVRRLDSAA